VRELTPDGWTGGAAGGGAVPPGGRPAPRPGARLPVGSFSLLVLSNETRGGNVPCAVIVYVIRDHRCSLDHPLGDAVDVLVRREDAERFVDEVRRDDPELARHLRIVERELEAGSLN
jgi:hypothetical protein